MIEVGTLSASFDQDDIEDLEADLQLIEGPDLAYYQHLPPEHPIVHLNSAQVIKTFLQNQTRDLKIVGNQRDSLFEAFFYLLLILGLQQKRCYPHLNTLIREQFYKPHIFYEEHSNNLDSQEQAMQQKCLGYFEEISQGKKIEDYIKQQPLFTKGCIIMLKNSLQEEDSDSPYQQLSNKFNLDMKKVKINEQSEYYLFAASNNYYIFKENRYYFLGLSQMKEKEDLSFSKYENESIRSGQSGLHLIVATASQKSTPKFKNSEVKYRKKSHKNSFGGDLQIVQYRDLLQMQYQKINNMNNAKVFSQYFDLNEVESCAENLQDNKFGKKNTFQDIIESQKHEKHDMKGSTTIVPTQNFKSQRRKDRKISSSEIIEYHDFNFMNKKEQKKKEVKEDNYYYQEDNKPNSYNSLVVVKDQSHIPMTKMRTSIIQQRQLERIEEFQSSQRQSTHPDQLSEPNDNQAEMSENQIQVKLKDRKYSYFTQQMASTKSKKVKEIQSSNYVFKIPKNLHKNEEIMFSSGGQNDYVRKRFHQNPLRFSQLPSEGSAHESNNVQKSIRDIQKTIQKLKLSSSVFSYLIKFQPANWYKKQTIYYMMDGTTEKHSFQKSFGQKEIKTNVVQQSTAFIRQSFGSSNTILSNNRHAESVNILPNTSTSIPRNPTKSVNPYELNEMSFLKERMNTSSSVTIIQPNSTSKVPQDYKSIQFSTYRSMKNIHSTPVMVQPTKSKGPKINFNYFSSNESPKTFKFSPTNMAKNSFLKPVAPLTPSFGSSSINFSQTSNQNHHPFSPFSSGEERTYGFK